jgi:C-terminal processing protease CtpA/Prc
MDVAQSLVDERGPPPDDGPQLVKVDAPKGIYRRRHVITPNPNETRLYTAKVYYLTSHRTASAAEHLALAFKRTHRATLVGETTAGGNHFGGVERIGAGLAVFLPVGRTFDPDTGWDWEGVGIAPDVATPAADALDAALTLASAP